MSNLSLLNIVHQPNCIYFPSALILLFKTGFMVHQSLGEAAERIFWLVLNPFILCRTVTVYWLCSKKFHCTRSELPFSEGQSCFLGTTVHIMTSRATRLSVLWSWLYNPVPLRSHSKCFAISSKISQRWNALWITHRTLFSYSCFFFFSCSSFETY